VDDAMQVIRRKCQKAYPEYFSLVVLARNGKVVELETIIQELQSIEIPFGDVWLLGRESGWLIKMAQLYPNLRHIDFDVACSLQKTKSTADFLHPQMRGNSTAFRDLGIVYLPIP
jgi:hypothetical protein